MLPKKKFLIALLLGTALAAGIFVATQVSKPSTPLSALIIPVPSDLPEFSLIDQSGKLVTADTFRGHWNLVFFGFTHCPDICPTTLQVLANARKALTDASADTVPRIVLVSVDPERDTPAILHRYLSYFGTGNLGITGELTEIRKLTSALGIYFEKAASDTDNYGVDHTAAVLVIDPAGRFSALFSAPHRVADYVHDLPIVMANY